MNKKKNESFYRAKLSILNDVCSFPTIRNKDWKDADYNPPIGSLVALSCAPVTKWYLSWVLEVEKLKYGNRYLLQSIEDGTLCWWENVGLFIYDPERVSQSPEWRWNDKQFEFQDRWKKVCRRNDAYIVLPGVTTFHDDSVTLSLRERHGGFGKEIPFHHEHTFENWKKTTMKMMDKFYKEGEKIYKKPKTE